MNNQNNQLILTILANGKLKEGEELQSSDGNMYRHDRCFYGNPTQSEKELFLECSNNSTQFFYQNYSFHMNADGKMSFIKYIDLDSKSVKITNKIKNTKGKFFSVSFVKKDGTTRNMTARIGVVKGVNGKGLNYIPSDKNLIVVYAMDKLSYRMINLETVSSFKFNKQLTNY
jgi:hypothetical protein